jgi:hypothetical protein
LGKCAGAGPDRRRITGKKRQRYGQIRISGRNFDLKFGFIGDFSVPPTRVQNGAHAKGRFFLRYFREKLRRIVLCHHSAGEVTRQKQLRQVLGASSAELQKIRRIFSARVAHPDEFQSRLPAVAQWS